MRSLEPLDQVEQSSTVAAVVEDQDVPPGDADGFAEAEAAEIRRQAVEEIPHGQEVVGIGVDSIEMREIY
jgi:hypothetical protein